MKQRDIDKQSALDIMIDKIETTLRSKKIKKYKENKKGRWGKLLFTFIHDVGKQSLYFIWETVNKT